MLLRTASREVLQGRKGKGLVRRHLEFDSVLSGLLLGKIPSITDKLRHKSREKWQEKRPGTGKSKLNGGLEQIKVNWLQSQLFKVQRAVTQEVRTSKSDWF